MNNKTKSGWVSWLIYILFFIVVIQSVNWWKTRDTQKGNPSDLSGELMDGSSFKIAAFSGEPVLFHFWAT